MCVLTPQIGAGIQLHPNAVRVLDAIGVWDKIRTKSVLPGAIVLKAYNTGQVLHSQDLRGNQQRYGAPLATVHRGQLREILYAEVMAQGIKVRHGINVDVANIDLSDGTLTLSGSGEIIRADLFVGADGGKSPIRQALVGRREMVPHGKIVNRILVDEAEILKSPRLRHLIDTPNCVLWLGPESKAVTYGLDGVFNIAFTWPWSTRPEDAFSSYQTVDLEDFKAQLGAWEPDLQELIGLGRGCLRWMLVEPKVNDEGTPWVSEKSNFCLVGDSAHSLLPYL
jgi:salicylate hydroxylase